MANQISGIILAGGRSSRMGEDKALLKIGGVPLLRIVSDVAIALCNPVYVVTPWTERYQNLLSPQCQFIREVPLQKGLWRRGKGAEESEGSRGASCDGGFPTRGSSSGGTPPLAYSLDLSKGAWSNYQLPSSNSPLVGFAQGLSHVTTDWVLLLACDLPCLRVEVLREWAGILDSVDTEAIALLAHHAKGWEPLCGFYRRSCLTSLIQYIISIPNRDSYTTDSPASDIVTHPRGSDVFNCNENRYNSGGRSFQGWLAQHPVQVLSLPDPQMLFNCNTPADYEEIQSRGEGQRMKVEG